MLTPIPRAGLQGTTREVQPVDYSHKQGAHSKERLLIPTFVSLSTFEFIVLVPSWRPGEVISGSSVVVSPELKEVDKQVFVYKQPF